jgi:hypothetical protein
MSITLLDLFVFCVNQGNWVETQLSIVSYLDKRCVEVFALS